MPRPGARKAAAGGSQPTALPVNLLAEHDWLDSPAKKANKRTDPGQTSYIPADAPHRLNPLGKESLVGLSALIGCLNRVISHLTGIQQEVRCKQSFDARDPGCKKIASIRPHEAIPCRIHVSPFPFRVALHLTRRRDKIKHLE